MPLSLHQRPWSALVLAGCGVALLVGATIRLGDVPFPSRGSNSRMNRLWQKDPASVSAGYGGWVCMLLALWLARSQQKLDDPNDPADDPIARLDESDPVPRPPVRDDRTDPR
jgi:hypothetical protein